MKITKKMGLYALLVLGGGGWVVLDQINTPSGAEAAPAEVANPVAVAQVVSREKDASSLAPRLEQVYRRVVKDVAFDPFTARGSVAPLSGSDQSVDAAKLKLTGIMQTESGGVAIINGQTVRVGQQYAGYRLLSTEHARILIERMTDKQRLTIHLLNTGKTP
jgi:hypothetical protein